MTVQVVTIPMGFNYVMFGAEVRMECTYHGLSYSEVDVLASVGHGATARFAAYLTANPTIGTLLKVCNVLNLDPRRYFELKF